MFVSTRFGQNLVLGLLVFSTAPHSASAQEADRGAPEAAVVSSQPELGIYTPMTQKERLGYFFEHTFSPESVLRSGAAAGINQAMDTPGEWGQGALGYGRRFASSYGGHIVQSTVMYGVSAALHEDNRYYRCPDSGAKARLKYAIGSTFLARHEDGSRHFSISAVSSYAAAAAISRAWQPPSTRGAENALSAFTIGVAADMGFNVAREFLPGILRTRPAVRTTSAYTGQ